MLVTICRKFYQIVFLCHTKCPYKSSCHKHSVPWRPPDAMEWLVQMKGCVCPWSADKGLKLASMNQYYESPIVFEKSSWREVGLTMFVVVVGVNCLMQRLDFSAEFSRVSKVVVALIHLLFLKLLLGMHNANSPVDGLDIFAFWLQTTELEF